MVQTASARLHVIRLSYKTISNAINEHFMDVILLESQTIVWLYSILMLAYCSQTIAIGNNMHAFETLNKLKGNINLKYM